MQIHTRFAVILFHSHLLLSIKHADADQLRNPEARRFLIRIALGISISYFVIYAKSMLIQPT